MYNATKEKSLDNCQTAPNNLNLTITPILWIRYWNSSSYRICYQQYPTQSRIIYCLIFSIWQKLPNKLSKQLSDCTSTMWLDLLFQMTEKGTLEKFLLELLFDILAFTALQWPVMVMSLSQQCHLISHPCHIKNYMFRSYHFKTNDLRHFLQHSLLTCEIYWVVLFERFSVRIVPNVWLKIYVVTKQKFHICKNIFACLFSVHNISLILLNLRRLCFKRYFYHHRAPDDGTRSLET